ncbi:ABC transporter substrate-binding protein [Enterocloster lavalensis]|uniref:NitT/TauT family transport system substrate-binding protein n=1 Tax=Enterocloster lavalensis TaxID=460384 RepID=A0A1I0GLU4_9FIRM|nr:MqnA/MqnD/SBP family protein [Enterocloster lavalensis]SET72000.1 NitT/TauT family transport system substrate-binding protein [Enterocloster lavalensis]
MKKSVSAVIAALMAASAILAGCGSGNTGATVAETAAETTAGAAAGTSASETSATETQPGTTSPGTEAEKVPATLTGDTGDNCQAGVRVGSLKGPTSMGLVYLMDKAQKGETENHYEFTMTGAADELVGKIASGDLDIALIPANVASVLYTKTQKNVTVLDINTLGVLYVVASDDSITSVADLKGKTVYMTGKGTTPEYVMNYLLKENGLAAGDVDLQFKSEATEVASLLKENPDAIGVLPQPFATAACIQNEALKPVVDLTEAWNALNQDSGSMLVTGVTIVRSDFLRENRAPIQMFLEDHKESAQYAVDHVDETAELVAAAGIVEKAPIAKKALPYCNIVCMTGQEMKDALSGYLNVLYEQDAKSVGGQLPGDEFYYMP